MKKILAIGGAVIKTARFQLAELIRRNHVEVLIHNGGSIFHDFQLATEKLKGHSHPLDELVNNFECNRPASDLIWSWIDGNPAPENSVSRLCEDMKIPVLMFTGLGCDFWHLFNDRWDLVANKMKNDFKFLQERFSKPFHYICMGSAVIHPEVFTKLIAINSNRQFIADAVDFNHEAYRPRSRVAKYGTYYKMNHIDFLEDFLKM